MSRGRKVSEAYPIQTLHRIFLVSAGLFLASMVWMVWDDYDRPWKAYQREFLLLQREKKQQELARIAVLEERLTKLDGEISWLQGTEAKIKTLVELREKKAEVERKLVPASQAAKFQKAIVDAAKYVHDRAAAELMHHETAQTRAAWSAAKQALEEVQREFNARVEAEQSLQGDRDSFAAKIAERESRMSESRKLVARREKRGQVSAELSKLRAQEKELATDLGFMLRNAPVLDMLNPNLKIQQVVLPKMKFNIFFADVQTVDRCMTCHLAVDKPGWDDRTHRVSGAEYAALRRAQGPAFHPEPAKAKWSGKAKLDDARLAEWVEQYGYVKLSKVSGKRKTTTVPREELAAWRGRWGEHLQAGKRSKNKQSGRWEVPISFPASAEGQALLEGVITHPYRHPFRSHPHLELFAGSTSPHPISHFGCRSCHNGMGRATDFVRATHTPADKQQATAWKTQYGWHMLHDKEWKSPQWPLRHLEAGCVKCHADVVDLQPMPWTLQQIARTRPAKPEIGIRDRFPGEKVYDGKQLFLRNGCNGCHAVESLRDVPKTGPSLAHVRSKLTRSFMRKWIEAPREFRPGTWMPHVFKIAHQLDPLSDVATADVDFGSLAARPGAKKDLKKIYPNRKKLISAIHDVEIAALAEYLHQNSTGIRIKKLPLVGDPEQGKALFRDKGCLGCHKMDDFPLEGEPVRRFGPDLSQVGSKFAEGKGQGWLYTWLVDPRGYHRASRMPNPRLQPEEAAHLAAYLDNKRLPADSKFLKKKPGRAPADLVAMRLVSFLEGNMRTDQAWKVVGMLDETTRRVWLGEKVISKQGCFGCHIMPEGAFVQRKIESTPDLKRYLERSRLLRYTRASRFNEMPGIGTELSDWGTKLMTKLDFGLQHDPDRHTRWDFIVTKLMTPRIYDEGLYKPYDDMLRMPHFAVSLAEAEAIATFVMGQQKGKLDERYRYAETRENYQKRPWELQAEVWRQRLDRRPPSRWSPAERSSFTATVRRLEGKAAEKEQVRLSQVRQSLAEGGPSPEDAGFVLGLQDKLEGRIAPQWTDPVARRQAIIEGRKLVQQFNCQGCHLIEGRGWELRDYMARHPYPGLKPTDVPEAAPPFLSQARWDKQYEARWRNFQGARTRTAWLFDFLRNPDSSPTLRPWLRVKMPNFHMTVEQANTLTRYFAALDGTAWPNDEQVGRPSKKDYRTTARLFKTNDCFGCHRPTPAAGKKGAPDLELAGRRLRADWVAHWVYNPSRFIPFTAMPSGQIPDPETARAVTRVIMDRDAVRRLKQEFRVPLGDK